MKRTILFPPLIALLHTIPAHFLSTAPKKRTIFPPLIALLRTRPAHFLSTAPKKNMSTFYRRKLPDTSISFSSTEGRSIFASSMSHGGTYCFFPLIEQLQTQPEPAYCGLTTLVIILNALAVDPRRLWKGPWRWYEEKMLNCCVDLEQAKETGISFDTFKCLAKCQGLDVRAIRGSDSTVDEFRNVVKQICSNPASLDFPNPTSFLIVSYTRKVIGQTGTGHFSPIGAYDEASDQVLLLDTARFKYGPHWIKLELMFEALLPIDDTTGKSRGYMVLSLDGVSDGECKSKQLSHLPQSILYRVKNSMDFVNEYKQFIELEPEIDLHAVISFWTKFFDNGPIIHEFVKPQLRPVKPEEVKLVDSLQKVIKTMIRSIDEKVLETSLNEALSEHADNKECCNTTMPSSQRFIQISPIESIFVVFLASISKEARDKIIRDASPEGSEFDKVVIDQLIAEAELLCYAIETCDLY